MSGGPIILQYLFLGTLLSGCSANIFPEEFPRENVTSPIVHTLHNTCNSGVKARQKGTGPLCNVQNMKCIPLGITKDIIVLLVLYAVYSC